MRRSRNPILRDPNLFGSLSDCFPVGKHADQH